MIITVKGPRRWSQGDEGAFFRWLNSIKAIRSWGGVGAMLELRFATRKVSAHDLRELYALVRRYRMDLGPLEPLNQPRPERLKNLSAASQSR